MSVVVMGLSDRVMTLPWVCDTSKRDAASLACRTAMPRAAGFKQGLCAEMNGFSLHAAVRCGADERQARQQLCRCITRPALANERVQCNAAGQVVLKLKTPLRDGTTHLVMSPLEFMQWPIEWPVCGGQIHSFYVGIGVGSGRSPVRSRSRIPVIEGTLPDCAVLDVLLPGHTRGQLPAALRPSASVGEDDLRAC